MPTNNETLSLPGHRADAILDALAKRALDNKPLPSRVTVAGVETPTLGFLRSFEFDRRPAVAPLARLAPDAIMNPQVNEVVAVLIDMLEVKPVAPSSGNVAADHPFAGLSHRYGHED